MRKPKGELHNKPLKIKKTEMIQEKIYAIHEPAATNPLSFDTEKCNGCNICVDVCQIDVLIPNSEKGKVPIVLYPGECWYCGSCVAMCRQKGAIELNSQAMNSVHWKRKETCEDFWLR